MVGSKGVTKQLWYVQSIYTRGKPEVSHVPSWTMRWKGSVTALAPVLLSFALRKGMHGHASAVEGSEDANKNW